MTAIPPPGIQPPPPLPAQDQGIASLIPYKNGAALAAYYLGVFSLIPVIGFVLGVIALIMGLVGLSRAGKNPQIRGKVHAWVGIILGGLVVLAHIAVVVLIIAGTSHRR
jgi:ABC-type Co2+ transport system permease subunit